MACYILTNRQNVVGWRLVLHYMRTPPAHYYLESSGWAASMETHPYLVRQICQVIIEHWGWFEAPSCSIQRKLINPQIKWHTVSIENSLDENYPLDIKVCLSSFISFMMYTFNTQHLDLTRLWCWQRLHPKSCPKRRVRAHTHIQTQELVAPNFRPYHQTITTLGVIFF